jgi:hypothetical protein
MNNAALHDEIKKLASEHPELREHLVPLLKQGSKTDWDSANIYLKSLRGSVKVLGNAIGQKKERNVILETKLLLKYLSSILTAIGKDQEAEDINKATNKIH